VAQGRRVFAANCAGCHSSQNGPYDNVDFRAADPKDPTLRADFLSNERPLLASRIGTHTARALHSNHMSTRVWDQYASRTLQERAPDPALPELQKGGGRGYYRPPSLLSVWAHAPFMHNNAIGPEICGKPSAVPDGSKLELYVSPYVDAAGKRPADPPACWTFDPSVEGRYKLFKASVADLLNPSKRIPKMFLTSEDIIVDVAPQVKFGDLETGLSLRLPKDTPAQLLNSLRYKDLIQDMVLAERNPEKLEAKYEDQLTVRRFKELKAGLAQLRSTLLSQPGRLTIDITRMPDGQGGTAGGHGFIQAYYSNALSLVENAGHRFGEGLSDRDKQALTAFLATL
jgi:hypothetical protein